MIESEPPIFVEIITHVLVAALVAGLILLAAQYLIALLKWWKS